jgi:hypothetical protein
LSVKLFENCLPKALALKIQLGGTNRDLSKWKCILNCEYVDIFDCDGNNDWVHGIIDFDFMVNDVLEDWGNVEIKEELDVVLSNQ